MDREYMISNLESIKEMVVNNGNFISSKLFKMIKKNKITLDGIEFLLENFSNMWWVRDALVEYSRVSYKDAVKINFSNILFDNGMYLNYYKNMTNFFSSSKDVHEFALEHFGIDFYASREVLVNEYQKIKRNEDKQINLRSFLSTFLNPHLVKAKLFENDERRKELLEIFEDLPLIAGMAKMESLTHSEYRFQGLGTNVEGIEYLLSSGFYSVPVIDLDKHIEFIDKTVQYETFKNRAYLKMFNTLFYDLRDPKLRFINITTGFKFLLNNCIKTLDTSIGDGSELVDVLSTVRNQYLFPIVKDIIYEDIVCDKYILNRLRGYSSYDYIRVSLISTLLGSSPAEKIEETYEKIRKAFPYQDRMIYSAIYTLSSSVKEFDVTRKITLDMVENKVDWDRLVLPLKDLHNEEFLETIIQKVGKFDMLTGGYSDFFIEKFQPALLSEKFINKYKDYIRWDDLSRNKNLTLDFLKKYKEKIKISSLHDSIIKILDEEIIEYFILNNKSSNYYLNNLSGVENISFDFAKKYMEVLISENYRKLSIGSKGAFKLADFVASLA